MPWNFFGIFSKKDKDVKQIDDKSVNENDIKLAEEKEKIDEFVSGVNLKHINYKSSCSQLRDLVNEMCTNRKDKKTRFYNNMIKILFPIKKALNGSEIAKNNALRALSKFSVISSTWNREVRSSVKKLYKLHTDHLKDKIKSEKENIENVAEFLNACSNKKTIVSCCEKLYNLISDLVSSRISSRSKFKDSVAEGGILYNNKIEEIIKGEKDDEDLNADDMKNIKEWTKKVQEIKSGHFSSWNKNIRSAVKNFAGYVENLSNKNKLEDKNEDNELEDESENEANNDGDNKVNKNENKLENVNEKEGNVNKLKNVHENQKNKSINNDPLEKNTEQKSEKSDINEQNLESKNENNPSKNEPKPNPVPEVKNNPKSVKQNNMRENIIDTLNSKQKLVDFKIGIEVLKAPENWKKPSSKNSTLAKDKENS